MSRYLNAIHIIRFYMIQFLNYYLFFTILSLSEQGFSFIGHLLKKNLVIFIILFSFICKI